MMITIIIIKALPALPSLVSSTSLFPHSFSSLFTLCLFLVVFVTITVWIQLNAFCAVLLFSFLQLLKETSTFALFPFLSETNL